MIEYMTLKEMDGRPNTPPSFPMYINANIFLHAEKFGGIEEIANNINLKSRRIYTELDTYPIVY